MTSFAAALAAAPRALDGGLGTLLGSRGHDLESELWSARILLEQPGEVRRAHEDYFAAGARVAISGSYQVSYEGLAAAGLARGEVDALLALSVRLAREARDAAGLRAPDAASGSARVPGPVLAADPAADPAPPADPADPALAWVAASVGPFGAARADGSEYTGDYGVGVAELRAWHRPRLAALAAGEPDLLAVETIPSLAEVEAVCRELEGGGVPAWLSVTAAYGALRTGESLAEAYAIADAVPEVAAVGVNCCDPRDVLPAIEAARRATSKPVVVYPNSGERWDEKNRRWMGEPSLPDRLVASWLDAGARLVGGCCRVGPEQIARIAELVSAPPARPRRS